jgi:hypothetical protein
MKNAWQVNALIINGLLTSMRVHHYSQMAAQNTITHRYRSAGFSRARYVPGQIDGIDHKGGGGSRNVDQILSKTFSILGHHTLSIHAQTLREIRDKPQGQQT